MDESQNANNNNTDFDQNIETEQVSPVIFLPIKLKRLNINL